MRMKEILITLIVGVVVGLVLSAAFAGDVKVMSAPKEICNEAGECFPREEVLTDFDVRIFDLQNQEQVIAVNVQRLNNALIKERVKLVDTKARLDELQSWKGAEETK